MCSYSEHFSKNLFNLTFILVVSLLPTKLCQVNAQTVDANRSGFTWVSTENINDTLYGSGYTVYSAAWPVFKDYPGANNFQMGLGGCWLTTQRTGNEPEQFYTTIEGGLGWWHDTRFATKVPKFIMGGVSLNFHAWANGPGAGKTGMLPNGQRDWSSPGGKYGVAQLSNKLLWAPDGLNMAQSLNGEMLGYGYTPLPLTEPMMQTNGQDLQTGNQCWTLFLNSTNFKGPATFFLPTFWTEPALDDLSLEGLFLDTRPSDPNIGFGFEHASSPALISEDEDGNLFAKIEPLQFPASNNDNSMLLNQISVYSQNALWNAMESWFDGGSVVQPGIDADGTFNVSFTNNGGSMMGEISENWYEGDLNHEIELTYIDNVQQTENIMGYAFDTETVHEEDGLFILPEYFGLNSENKWQSITEDELPPSTNLISADVPTTPRSEIPYLTPLDPDCQWQDPNGPWNNPGPSAGPYYAKMEDGSTLTYYWYRFVDQPAIIQANLPDNIREALQTRVELIHSNWSHTDEYMAAPAIGDIATLDPNGIVTPPAGLEIGYVPIVSKQEKSTSKVRVFVMAGQSNMQGYGKIYEGSNGANGAVVETFTPTCNGSSSETCDFIFNMSDSYGDGWNGWVYDFIQNGVVVATETLSSGSSGTSIVSLETGVSCDVVVNTAGSYGSEVSWVLTNSSGIVQATMIGANDNYPAPNTLLDVVSNDTDGQWSMLESDGEWNVLDNAYLYFPNGQGDTIRDHVSIGQGAYPDLIGPELMFAHQMDEYYEDPILIIKTAWGGKSLAVDFRPPSAGGETGEYYNAMIQTIQQVTQNIETEFPEIGPTEFEISGFAWFQGWNDGGDDAYLNEYESNLHHLINDVRNDLGKPNLPFVVASSGHGGYEPNWGWIGDMQEIISVAQENVACDDATYGGSLGFIDTKPFYMNASDSPDDAVHHFHNNALSFLNIGKYIGEEMILAINEMAFCSEDCDNQIDPGILSIGNRVWNDYNMDGVNNPNEPGIPDVSVLLWADSDGDGVPDWQGFSGVQITDDEGYYTFSGLAPGNYTVFVWQVDNWGPGEPLEGFQSTNNFVENANNDQDYDNNGFGNPYTDIMSGIVTLSLGEEPLGDGDPFDCYFNYDANGNNSVDFGFFNPNAEGCMDPAAENYNLSAISDDGSCEYFCDENSFTVVVELETDDFPGETSWNLVSQAGDTLFNFDGFTQNNTLFLDTVCVPKDDYITFNIFDSYGDGICCGHGNGYFNLNVCGEQVLSGGDFEFINTGVFYNCDLTDVSVNCQNIELPLGWSIFSTFIYPENPSIENVLFPVVNDLVIVKDFAGSAYLPDYAFNGIGLMEIGQGYQSKATDFLSFDICGERLNPEEHPINLSIGWNMIGYLRQEPAQIAAVLADVTQTNNLIIAKDYMGNAYLPEWDFNGIGDMMPGRGYQLKVVLDDVLYFLSNSESY